MISWFTCSFRTPHMHWTMGRLPYIMISRDQWLFKGHWHSPCTVRTAGILPIVRAVQVDCERVYGRRDFLRKICGGTEKVRLSVPAEKSTTCNWRNICTKLDPIAIMQKSSYRSHWCGGILVIFIAGVPLWNSIIIYRFYIQLYKNSFCKAADKNTLV